MKNTKIITTIGPNSEGDRTLAKLIESGANIFRFNMKHGEISWHNEVIERAQKIANEKHFPLGIMIDLQGPEIRISLEGDLIELEEKEEVYFSSNFIEEEKVIKVSNPKVLKKLKQGDKLLIDDGFYEFKVLNNENGQVLAQTIRGGRISDHKGLNIPSQKLDLPSLIKEDLEKLDLAAKREIDYIALSFTRTKTDIQRLKEEMKKRDIKAEIIAKIENGSALENLDEIIDEADGIMIARGDLGIETPLEEIAYWQKEIIKRCRKKKTPVIVATQMLESMTENPLPTRAEVTDVANAIFNGTDAVMLSGETATGDYPIEAVKAMNRIITFNEPGADLNSINFKLNNSTDLLMNTAVRMIERANQLDFQAILVFTKDGATPKLISSLRPKIPIYAITNKKELVEKLTICYGITDKYTVFKNEDLKKPDKVISKLKEEGELKRGKKVLIFKAQHWERPNLSNTLTILEV